MGNEYFYFNIPGKSMQLTEYFAFRFGYDYFVDSTAPIIIFSLNCSSCVNVDNIIKNTPGIHVYMQEAFQTYSELHKSIQHIVNLNNSAIVFTGYTQEAMPNHITYSIFTFAFLDGLQKSNKQVIAFYNPVKKLFSAAGRYEPSRSVITGYLHAYTDSTVGYNINNKHKHKIADVTDSRLISIIPDSRKHAIVKSLQLLQDAAPLLIDSKPMASEYTVTRTINADKKLSEWFPDFTQRKFFESMQSSAVNVVCETMFDGNNMLPSISEKMMYSIFAYRPFILVSTPNSLEFAKQYGFRTFDRWWDESYDTIVDDAARMNAILDLVDFINSKSILELKTMLKSMHSTLMHNRRVLKNLHTTFKSSALEKLIMYG